LVRYRRDDIKLFGEDKQQDRDTIRQVFLGSEAGKRTLGMLLFELGYFSPAETPETVATKNFATDLVKSLADGDENELAGMLINGLSGQWTMSPIKKEE
jgi:hypothetical protein